MRSLGDISFHRPHDREQRNDLRQYERHYRQHYEFAAEAGSDHLEKPCIVYKNQRFIYVRQVLLRGVCGSSRLQLMRAT